MQVSDDQHHREQQHQCAEVNEAQGFRGVHNAEGDHKYGADNRHTWSIDLHSGKLTYGKNEIAYEENAITYRDLPISMRAR